MTTTLANYKNYIKTVKDAEPPSETRGKVKSMIEFYKNDAFVQKEAPKSHDSSHGFDQCVRVHQSLNFWKARA